MKPVTFVVLMCSFFAGAAPAWSGFIGLPMNLRAALSTAESARAPAGQACEFVTDDVLIGPVSVRIC